MSDTSGKVISDTIEIVGWQEKIEKRNKIKKYLFYPPIILLATSFFVFTVLGPSFVVSYFRILLIGTILLVEIFFVLFSWIYVIFILYEKDIRWIRITIICLFILISATIIVSFTISINQSAWLGIVNESNHRNSIEYPEKVGKFILSSVREKNVKSGTKRGLPNGKFVSMEEWVNIYYSPENKLEYPFANIHIEKSISGSFEQDKSNLTDLIIWEWENERSKKVWTSSIVEYLTWVILAQYPYQEITMKEGNLGVKSHIIIFDKKNNISITIYFLNQGDVNNTYRNDDEFLENKKQFLEELLSFFKK